MILFITLKEQSNAQLVLTQIFVQLIHLYYNVIFPICKEGTTYIALYTHVALVDIGT